MRKLLILKTGFDSTLVSNVEIGPITEKFVIEKISN